MASETVRLSLEDRVVHSRLIHPAYAVAGRTILHPILTSLERIAFEDDPLRIMLIETSYQPFISLFHMLDVLNERPDLAGIRTYRVRIFSQHVYIFDARVSTEQPIMRPLCRSNSFEVLRQNSVTL